MYDFSQLALIDDFIEMKAIISNTKLRRMQLNFDALKITSSILTMLADFDNSQSSESSLFLFKSATNYILDLSVKPLLEALSDNRNMLKSRREDINSIDFHYQILAKWWVNYFSILNETFQSKKNVKNWENSFDLWWNDKDNKLLKNTQEILEEKPHWKIMLMRGLLVFRSFFELSRLSENKQIFDNYYKEIKEYLRSRLLTEIQVIKLSNNQLMLKYGEKILTVLKNIVEMDDDEFKSAAIIHGRFDKNIFKDLDHSVILGDDGGLYALLNKISEDEKNLIVQEEIKDSHYVKNNWKLNSVTKQYKIIIGNGAFGKIRLSMALTKNEVSSIMKPGKIVCVKKSAHINKVLQDENNKKMSLRTIREISWNDYSVGDVQRLVYAPIIYDFKIIECLSTKIIDEKHQKGYTIQEFKALYDGSRVFRKKKAIYYGNWDHQKSYLVSIFEAISQLLNKGICMTDLKPQNTLYDGENYRGMLIDLGGVIKKANRKELTHCKGNLKYNMEFTPKYASPELQYKDSSKEIELEEKDIDLPKCTSYALGKMINEIVLKESASHNYYQELKELSDKLTLVDWNQRISVEQGLTILLSIGNLDKKQEIDFTMFIKTLKHNIYEKDNFIKFGINPNIIKIENNYINLKATELDPEKYENLKCENLAKELDDFIFDKEKKNKDERVFILLGASGSGKSTLLQMKYLDALNKWTKNDPVPFLINLAVDEDIINRWKWLTQEIELASYQFNLFSGGFTRYPMIIFIDSFDEVPSKINFVEKFFNDLGNNKENKCIICCQSSFIQKDHDFLKWFKPSENDALIKKKYIMPLNKAEFNYVNYVTKYFEKSIYHSSLIKIIDLLNDKNLKELMKTSYMVHLTLEVLPEIKPELKHKDNKFEDTAIITRSRIYEKYMQKKIANIVNDEKKRVLFCQYLHLKNDGNASFIEFMEESANLLSQTLHKVQSTKITLENGKIFFEKCLYLKNIQYFENQILLGVIQALDLVVEIRPHEQISLGFSHDSLKNYILTKLIIKETLIGVTLTLGERLIIEDEALLRFLIELVKEDNVFKSKLMELVYKTKEISEFYRHDNDNPQKIIAAANSISILVSANVSFASIDLSNIKICGASLRDGNFIRCDFSDADLSDVNLINCKLDSALFQRTRLNKVIFNNYSEITTKLQIKSVAFSSQDYILAGCSLGYMMLWDSGTFDEVISPIHAFTKWISFVCFSHDSSIILGCGGETNLIRTWDITGKALHTYKGHKKTINYVTFSSDTTKLLSCSKDRLIILWNLQTEESIIYKGEKSTVLSTVFNENKILAAFRNDYLCVWDQASHIPIKSMKGECDGAIDSACFSTDGKFLLSAKKNQCYMKLRDTETVFILNTFENIQFSNKSISFITFNPGTPTSILSVLENVILLWDIASSNLKIFEGHDDKVNSVCFSHDGSSIISGSEDRSIKMWTRDVGNLVKNYEGHDYIVNSLCFSQDGATFISGSADKSIRLWNKYNGKLLKKYEGDRFPIGEVNCVCFSPDDMEILSGCADNTLILWNRITGSKIRFFGHSDSVITVCFSHDGNLLASGSKDMSIRLWEKSSESTLKTLKGHTKEIISVYFGANDNMIYSAAQDNVVKLWDWNKEICLKDYEYPFTSYFLNKFYLTLDCQKIAISSNNDIAVLDSTSFEKEHEFKFFNLKSFCFSWDSQLVIAVSTKSMKIWDLNSNSLVVSINVYCNNIVSIACSPDNLTIVTGSSSGEIKVWEKSQWQNSRDQEITNSSINTICVSHSGFKIASGSSDSTVKLWEKGTGILINTLKGHKGSITTVCFSHDEVIIASGSSDKTVKLWDNFTGHLLNTLYGHQDSVTSIVFVKNGNELISASFDKTIKIWNINNGELIRSFEEHGFPFTSISISYSLNQNILVSASIHNFIILWDITTGKMIKKLNGHNNIVTCVCFSQDGLLIASGSIDRTIKLWDKTTFSLKMTFKKHENLMNSHKDWVTTVCFSPDGKFVLSGSFDKSIILWDCSGNIIKEYKAHTKSIRSLCFCPEGFHFISCSADNSFKIWDKETGNILYSNEENKFRTYVKCFSPEYEYKNRKNERIASYFITSTYNSINTWDKTTEGAIGNSMGNPLHLLNETNEIMNFKNNFDYYQKHIITSNETNYSFKEMVLIGEEDLASTDQKFHKFLLQNKVMELHPFGPIIVRDEPGII